MPYLRVKCPIMRPCSSMLAVAKVCLGKFGSANWVFISTGLLRVEDAMVGMGRIISQVWQAPGLAKAGLNCTEFPRRLYDPFLGSIVNPIADKFLLIVPEECRQQRGSHVWIIARHFQLVEFSNMGSYSF